MWGLNLLSGMLVVKMIAFYQLFSHFAVSGRKFGLSQQFLVSKKTITYPKVRYFIPCQTHVGHTSMPAFSDDGELLRYFPGHTDAFRILLYGVYPVLLWFSRLSFCITYIPVYSLSWQSVVVHSQNVPKPSQSSFFYDEIYFLQLCLRPDPLITDFAFPCDTHYLRYLWNL